MLSGKFYFCKESGVTKYYESERNYNHNCKIVIINIDNLVSYYNKFVLLIETKLYYPIQ